MDGHALLLVGAVLVLVLLTFAVGTVLYLTRAREMRARRIHPQSVATSAQMAANLQNQQAADNFRNLFEVPVMFYALAVMAVAIDHVTAWLVAGCWLFVALRIAHSVIHCTYNRVMHRFYAYLGGLCVLIVLWLAWFGSLLGDGMT